MCKMFIDSYPISKQRAIESELKIYLKPDSSSKFSMLLVELNELKREKLLYSSSSSSSSSSRSSLIDIPPILFSEFANKVMFLLIYITLTYNVNTSVQKH
jgi:hypothetical protein